MVELNELVKYCDERLMVNSFVDYCPNGLQIEGKAQVAKIVTGVTASQALIEAAVMAGADCLLVHHGYFWKGESAPLVGMKYRRIKALLDNGISLLAYHLPLDAHPQLGNNAQLGQRLGLEIAGRFLDNGIGYWAEPAESLSASELAERITKALGRTPLVIAPPGERHIRRVAWCSGAAQGYLEQAAALGVDAYISGEISEHTVHAARELGMHYFAAGHHATERYGVQALGAELLQHFYITHEFIDIPNPV